MKFTDRREFLYDPELFKRYDTQTALKFHDEAVRRYAAKPSPLFYEVDRSATVIDPLWRQPIGHRIQFTRTLEVPCIVQKQKLRWDLTGQGRIPKQTYKFWTSNLILESLNYFPLQGDLIYYEGYRTEITKVEFEPTAYWQQTNVWLGIVYVSEIVPEGDMKPLVNPSKPAPVEMTQPGPTVPIDKSKPAPNPVPLTDNTNSTEIPKSYLPGLPPKDYVREATKK